jgi:integral membrane sensor domain MASE1
MSATVATSLAPTQSTPIRRPRQLSPLARLDTLPGPALFAIAAVSYWGLTYLGYSLPYLPNLASPLWPPAGIAALLLIAVSKRSSLVWVAAGIFAGEVISDLMHSQALLDSLGFGLSTLVYIPPALLIRRLGLYERGLVNRVADTLIFLLLAVVMGFANGAVALVVALANGYGDYLNFYITWSTGSTLGIMLVTPLLVTWLSHPISLSQLRDSRHEALLLLVSLVAVGAAVLVLFSHWAVGSGSFVDGHQSYGPVGLLAPYLIVALIVFGAWRLGPRGATLLLFVAALGIAYQTGAGRGPFAQFTSSPTNALYVSQLAFALLAVTVLLIAAARVALSSAEGRYRALFQEAPAMYVVARPSRSGVPTWPIATTPSSTPWGWNVTRWWDGRWPISPPRTPRPSSPRATFNMPWMATSSRRSASW